VEEAIESVSSGRKGSGFWCLSLFFPIDGRWSELVVEI